MEDEDVLEVGRPRRRNSALIRVLAVLAVAGLVAGYFLTRGDHHGAPTAAGSTSAATTGPASSAAVVPTGSPPSQLALPPWPQADGACGNTAFLPLVTAAPLRQRTGLRLVVGDRLSAVDVDAGTVRPPRGLPAGSYATSVATAAGRTYALLVTCGATFGDRATVVRIGGAGVVHTVAHGRYGALLGGGAHIWAVAWPGDGSTAVLDPLDGGRTVRLPHNFAPVAAHGELIVGETPDIATAGGSTQVVQLFDPSTGRTMRALGRASSIGVGAGMVIWAGTNCGRCPVVSYDLATRTRTLLPFTVPGGLQLWSAVISPDRRFAALIRERSEPSQYNSDHPGNPNEVVLLDLRTGDVHPVPGLVLWTKSFPGMAFAPNSRWLVLALDEGSGLQLLVWHPGLPAPLASPTRVRGPVALSPSIASVT
jgi:hypothetical protein